MKKKISVLLIVFIILIGLFGTKTFATNSCTIECSVSNNSPKRGDQIEVIVSAKDIVNPVAAIAYSLNYDNSKLELIGQVQSLNNWEVSEVENTYFVFAPNYEAVSTGQQCCKLVFKVKDNAILGNTTISFENVQISKDDHSIENVDNINLELNIEQKDVNINVNYSTTEKTNQPVEVTISSQDELQAIEGWNRSQDGKTLTKAYSENVEENVVVKDLFENEATATIHIDNIDKVNPIITAQNIIYGDVLSIRLQDAQSGIIAWQLNQSQDEPTSGWTDIELTEEKILALTSVNAGTYYIWAKDKAGNISYKNVTVDAKDIRLNTTGITKSLSESICTYNGTGIEPREIIKDGTTELVKGTDYTVSYADNVNVGTGKVTITGTGNYKESVTLEFIINKKSIVVEWNSDTQFTYNKENQGPTLKYARLNGVNNEIINLKVTGHKKDAGTNYMATAVISSVTGGNANKNNYELTGANKQFEIMPKEIEVSVSDYDDFYDEQEHGIVITVLEPIEGYEIYYKEGTEPLTIDNYTTGNTTNPKMTEEGVYTVQWYVHSTDPNYTDISGSNHVVIEEVLKATGDMNQNEEIDFGDILVLLRHMAQANSNDVKQRHPQWELNNNMIIVGDMNKNGVIDLGDILKLRRYISATNNSAVATAHPSWLNLE